MFLTIISESGKLPFIPISILFYQKTFIISVYPYNYINCRSTRNNLSVLNLKMYVVKNVAPQGTNLGPLLLMIYA